MSRSLASVIVLSSLVSACGSSSPVDDAGARTDADTTLDSGAHSDASVSNDGGMIPDAGYTLVRSTDFAESPDEVRNPDRGFYRWDDGEVADLVLVKVQLGAWCNTATLPMSVKNALRTRLVAQRTAGHRAILRFVYADDGALNACGLADAASLTLVVGHVGQLHDVIVEHEDVIAVVEAGFFGMWGEWNAEYAPSGTSLSASASNRAALVTALLASISGRRAVVLRRPRFRDELSGSGLDLERVGFHNDCFLASADDSGTYDGSKTPEQWKTYIHDATSRVPMGGETCDDVPAYTACTHAKAELERLHFSYLHEGYSEDVIARWQSEGCLEEIRRRLGYRLVLRAVEAPASVPRDADLVVRIEVENVGYAPPYSTRRPRIVLRSGADVRVLVPTATEAVDTRDWAPGETTHAALSVHVPADLAAGEWEVRLLLLEDVSDAAAYAMIFANDDRVRDDTRRENLLGSVTITAE